MKHTFEQLVEKLSELNTKLLANPIDSYQLKGGIGMVWEEPQLKLIDWEEIELFSSYVASSRDIACGFTIYFKESEIYVSVEGMCWADYDLDYSHAIFKQVYPYVRASVYFTQDIQTEESLNALVEYNNQLLEKYQ